METSNGFLKNICLAQQARTKISTGIAVLLTSMLLSTAHAVPVTYTQNVWGATGGLADLVITDQRVKFTYTGDTDTIQSFDIVGPTRRAQGYFNMGGSTTVTVYGSDNVTVIATATFTNNDMFVSVDNTFGGIGFGWFDGHFEPVYPYAMFDTTTEQVLSTYDLSTDLFIFGSGLSCYNFEFLAIAGEDCENRGTAAQVHLIQTSLGGFYMQWDGVVTTTWSTQLAAVVPPPSTWLILLQ